MTQPIPERAHASRPGETSSWPARSLAPFMLVAMAASTLAFAVAILVSQNSASAIRGGVLQITENGSPSIAHLGEARRELWELELELNRLQDRVAAGQQPDVQLVFESLRQLAQAWSAYLLLPTFPGELALQEKVGLEVARTEDVVRRFARAASAHDQVAVAASRAEIASTFSSTDAALHGLIQINVGGSQEAALQIEDVRRSSSVIAYTLGAISTLITIVLAFVLYRAMGRLARLQVAYLAESSEERRELSARLRQSERLATLGQVVAEVAHELGTPLNVITGRADFLSEELAGNESALTTIGAIAEQARRITRIIQRLLNVAQERMPALEPVAVLRIIHATAHYLEPDIAAAGQSLRVEGTETLARADADLLQQVLLNLLQNALHAAGPGGTVYLRVSREDDQVVIDCIDDGPGVSPQILPRLFEPFATTKEGGQGTGLGLSISRALLRQMGGSLRYVERKTRGAHFRATLPEIPGESSAAESRSDGARATAAPMGAP